MIAMALLEAQSVLGSEKRNKADSLQIRILWLTEGQDVLGSFAVISS
jgi:hypothetical protein